MLKTWLSTILIILGMVSPLLAETVHLNTGEAIKGRITAVDDDMVTIESASGFGAIKVKRSDIHLVVFEQDGERDFSRRIGLGFVHRNPPPGVGATAVEYGVDALSAKIWMTRDKALDLLLGFFSASDDEKKILEVVSLEVRYLSVFSRRANLDLYWGGGLGIISVEDNTGAKSFSGMGSTARVFLGTEIFLVTLPNLGFSAELGLGSQSVGGRNVTNISTTSFPTFSIRYYY
ncbi:MAG: hypothetical protein OEZ59_02115 [Deltaproteobacteria bacterium]|nr:hypothetical protein [Deltaproteobacteria bacterium]